MSDDVAKFVALCNHGAQQARLALAGSAWPKLARALSESIKPKGER